MKLDHEEPKKVY